MVMSEPAPIMCSRIASSQKFVVIVLSLDSIGVSIKQFNVMPNEKIISDLLRKDVWIHANRQTHGSVSVVCPNEFTELPNLDESTQIAIETALWLWKDWSPELKEKIKPQPPIFTRGTHSVP